MSANAPFPPIPSPDIWPPAIDMSPVRPFQMQVSKHPRRKRPEGSRTRLRTEVPALDGRGDKGSVKGVAAADAVHVKGREVRQGGALPRARSVEDAFGVEKNRICKTECTLLLYRSSNLHPAI